ncbi:MAG: hypothetical protein V4463_09125 [Pseudomonadota bacterium]
MSLNVLALRRQALVTECTLQRLALQAQVHALVAPLESPGWRARMTVPVAIAGVIGGLLLTRPGRALPLLSAAATLWGIARKLLPLLRKEPAPPA